MQLLIDIIVIAYIISMTITFISTFMFYINYNEFYNHPHDKHICLYIDIPKGIECDIKNIDFDFKDIKIQDIEL